MYHNILIPLENSPADETILAHIKPLARMTGAKLLLVHVADGWVARNFNQLQLAESEEMKEDRAIFGKAARELTDEGFSCDAMLALGEPSDEIIKLAREKDVDLIAMTTHGHRLHQRYSLRGDRRQGATRGRYPSAAVARNKS